MKIEIELDDYISEEEKKEIVIETFRENIEGAFGGGEFDQSSKERERIINNSVAKWIEQHIESILTEDDINVLTENVKKTIHEKNDYSFYVFAKPDIWDRTEYSAYKIIAQAVKENENYIKEKVTESIKKTFDISDNY